jgi:hypothetical protein
MAQQLDTTNLRKQLEIIGVEAIGFITKILVENDKQVTGNLIKSLDFKIIKDVDGLFLSILAAPYFQYVDKGRKPGTYPPISAIRNWARIKGLPKGAEYGIQKNIYKFGIKPTNVIRRAQLRIETFREFQSKYEKGVVDSIVRSIKKDVETGNRDFISVSIT